MDSERKQVINPGESLADLLHKEKTALVKLREIKRIGTASEINAVRRELYVIQEKIIDVEYAMTKPGQPVRLF